MTTGDRFGISWRPELGMEILQSRESIDVIEVMPEHLAHFSSKELRTFNRLARSIPTLVHGVSLGLASAYQCETTPIEIMSRIVDAVEPEAWSEHLAFVRVPGKELGHLAAPPWCDETIESTLLNIETATSMVGSKPHLENIATLYYPPGSTMSEADWISKIIKLSGANLLLDVENVYANATNFKYDAATAIRSMALSTVRYIHIAGGSPATDMHGTFFVDDHSHSIVAEVFSLLEVVGSACAQPVTVILERDGNFPALEVLLAELEQARTALARGRAQNEISLTANV